MGKARTYDGPFNPPPAAVLANALGWHFETEHDPDNPGRWRPIAWRIFYADNALTVDYKTELAIRDTLVYSA